MRNDIKAKHFQGKVKYTLLIIISVVFISEIMIFTGFTSQLRNTSVPNLQNEIAERVFDKLENTLRTPDTINNINEAYLNINSISEASLASLQKLFLHELESFPVATIIAVGMANGEYREAQRMEDGSMRIGERSTDTGGNLEIWSVDDSFLKKVMEQQVSNYIPAERPWYRSAVYAQKATWSDVYFYSSNNNPAISGNSPLWNSDGEIAGVVTTSISLQGINTFLSKIHVSPGSKIIITESSGLLLASSDNQALISEGGERINGLKSEDPSTASAVMEFFTSSKDSFRIHTDHGWFLVKAGFFNAVSDLDLRIFIISPEKDFTQALDKLALRSYAVLIAMLLCSFIVISIISKKIASPITQLSEYISSVSFDSFSLETNIIAPKIDSASVEIESLLSNFTSMMQRLQNAFSDLDISRKEYKDLIENINSIIMRNSPDGVITYCNPYGLSFYGYTAEELIGSNIMDTILNTGDPENLNIFKKILKQENEYWNGENANITKDGRKVWILWSNRIIRNEDGSVREISAIGHDITGRVEADEKLERSLGEKNILLSEIHHRVKNNLQVIASLINLQLHEISDDRNVESLQMIKSRIQSMSHVHELLYSSTAFAEVNFNDYIRMLGQDILQTFNSAHKSISITVTPGDVEIEIDQAITLGLIVNELISNAVKYAFPERRLGKITVEITEDSESRVSLTVSDDGIGICKAEEKKSGLGTLLITALTKQLDASIETIEDNGTSIRLVFQKQTLKNKYTQ
ncbi:MAG TPA: hypothetical protein DCO79_04350 [Spirochaeta sp.]|nr:hypothetical protein [Spirochaeta sp.]